MSIPTFMRNRPGKNPGDNWPGDKQYRDDVQGNIWYNRRYPKARTDQNWKHNLVTKNPGK